MFAGKQLDGASQADQSSFSRKANSIALRGSTSEAVDRLNKSVKLNQEKPESLTKSWELSSMRRKGGAKNTIEMFNKVAEANQQNLDKNPFSETYSIQNFSKEASDYGRPTRGSKTEARGIKAGVHVSREVLFLCEIIDQYAEGEPPNRIIKFGPLFYIYSHYSDKLVGMLIRARKYKLVDFEGEMLYQRQDDEKIIRMLMSMEDIRKIVTPSGDPANCISVSK